MCRRFAQTQEGQSTLFGVPIGGSGSGADAEGGKAPAVRPIFIDDAFGYDGGSDRGRDEARTAARDAYRASLDQVEASQMFFDLDRAAGLWVEAASAGLTDDDDDDDDSPLAKALSAVLLHEEQFYGDLYESLMWLPVGWLAGWLVGWLAGWLAGWLVGWLDG